MQGGAEWIELRQAQVAARLEGRSVIGQRAHRRCWRAGLDLDGRVLPVVRAIGSTHGRDVDAREGRGGPGLERGQLGGLPGALGLAAGRRLETIAGAPPDLSALPPGCAFAERCPYATVNCRNTAPENVQLAPDHMARCLRTAATAE